MKILSIPDPKSPSPLVQYISVIALLLAFTALNLPNFARSFRYDEAFTLLHYTHDPVVALAHYNLPNNHLLHSFLVYLTRHTIGLSHLAVRLPAFTAGLLALAMTYRVGKQLVNHQTGLLAFVLVAANPTFADFSINARGYTLTIFFALLLFELVYLQRSVKGLAIFATCMGAMMTMPSMAVPIASTGIWVAWRFKRSRLRIRSYWMPILFGSATGLLFYVPTLLLQVPTEMLRFGSSNWQELITDLIALWFGSPAGYFLPILVVLFLFLPKTRLHHRYLLWIAFQLGVMLLLALAQQALTGTLFFARNYLYLLPFVVFLASLTMRTLNPRVVGWLTAGLFIVTVVPQTQSLNPPTEVDHLRGLIEDNTTQQDLVLAGGYYLETVYAEALIKGETDIFVANNDESRLVIIESRWDDFEGIVQLYSLSDEIIRTCQPADSDSWGPFSVHICSLQN